MHYGAEAFCYVHVCEVDNRNESLREIYIFEKGSLVVGCVELLNMPEFMYECVGGYIVFWIFNFHFVVVYLICFLYVVACSQEVGRPPFIVMEDNIIIIIIIIIIIKFLV